MRLTTLLPSRAVVMKSGNLHFLEASGPLQACNGTALPLPLVGFIIKKFVTMHANTNVNGVSQHSLGWGAGI